MKIVGNPTEKRGLKSWHRVVELMGIRPVLEAPLVPTTGQCTLLNRNLI